MGQFLGATYDHGERSTGLLMVTGGTELRAGAHGGMARLSAAIATAGFPVFRFDRRGVGDSSGDDPGFRHSQPDIAAAATAFRSRRPDLTGIVGFGLCDGATALAFAHRSLRIDALILANPWVVEPEDGLPPAAAVARRYRQRLSSVDGWRRIVTGDFETAKVLHGLRSLLRPHRNELALQVAAELDLGGVPLSVMLASGDATAIAFEEEWAGRGFDKLRRGRKVHFTRIESCSHSFAAGDDPEQLASLCVAALERQAIAR